MVNVISRRRHSEPERNRTQFDGAEGEESPALRTPFASLLYGLAIQFILQILN